MQLVGEKPLTRIGCPHRHNLNEIREEAESQMFVE